MPWGRVDDSWWCHPKVLGLSMAARGLWTTGLSWSCQMRRDVLPTSFVSMVVGLDDRDVVHELVAAGLWVEVDQGWRIHDWSEYQERSLSEKRAEAGRKGGLKSRPVTTMEANGKQTEVASQSKPEAKAEAGTRPVPSQTRNTKPIVPTDVDTPTTSKTRTRRPPAYTDEFNRFWQAYPRHPANGTPGGGGTKTEAFTEWVKLSDEDQTRALEACEPHGRLLRKSETPPKHACRFLRLRQFDDVLATVTPIRTSEVCPHCHGALDHHDDLYCAEVRTA